MREEPEERPRSQVVGSSVQLEKDLEKLKKHVRDAVGQAEQCRGHVRYGALAPVGTLAVLGHMLSKMNQMALDLGAPEEEPLDLPDERRSTDRDIGPSDRARARALDQKEQALCQKEQALSDKEQALLHKEQALADRAAALDQQQHLIDQARKDLLPQLELEQARAAVEQQRQDLDRQRAALDQQIQVLSQERQDLDQQRQLLLCASEQHEADLALLIEERDRLELLRQELEVERERLERFAAQLEQDRDQLRKDEYQFVTWTREERGLRWHDFPFGLDAALLCVMDHLIQAQGIARRFAPQFTKKYQLPTEGGPRLIYNVKLAAEEARQFLMPLCNDMLVEYSHKFPSQVEELVSYIEAHKKPPPDPYPTEPTQPRPPQKFALPTRALLGEATITTAQEGVLAFTEDGKELLTLNLNVPQAVVITGQMSFGKTAGLQVINELFLGRQDNLSDTQAPALLINAHYADSDDAPPPAWAQWGKPNDEPHCVEVLEGQLRARPAALPARRRIVYVLAMDDAAFEERKAQFPGFEVRRLGFGKQNLTAEMLRLFMGGHKKAPLYMTKINRVLLETTDPYEFIEKVEKLDFTPTVRGYVNERLVLLKKLLSGEPLGGDLGPKDFVGLDLRSSSLTEQDAMVIFAAAMKTFAELKDPATGKLYPKVMVFDEAHKYMGKGASAEIVKMIREMRANQMSVVVASQDPESLNPAILRLSTIQIAYQLKSKKSLKVLRDNCVGWEEVTIEELAELEVGWVMLVAIACADARYRKRAQKAKMRPPASKPGGTTKKAVKEG